MRHLRGFQAYEGGLNGMFPSYSAMSEAFGGAAYAAVYRLLFLSDWLEQADDVMTVLEDGR